MSYMSQAPPLDPSMMGGAPMSPPMAPPMSPPMPPAGGGMIAPAVSALPGMSQLAIAQQAQLADHQRQMAMMQEEMQKQMMILIASLPTPNPAGEAAVSTPMTPMMSGAGAGMSGASAPMSSGSMGMMDGSGAY